MKKRYRVKIKKKVMKDRSSLTRRDLICRKIIEYGILGLIIFSPLPAASVEEWSILVIQLSVLVMMAVYFIMREKPQDNKLLSLSTKWPKYLFLSLFVFIFIQIIPLPKFMFNVLSPNAYSFQELYTIDFSSIKFMSLSLIPTHTLRAWLQLFSYFLFGFLVVKTVTQWRQIKRIFTVVIAMGVFEAFYGLFELYNKNPRILFYEKIHNLDSVTGTFVNRNHLSGYLEMIIPLALGLIIARADFFSMAGLRWKEKLFRLSEKNLSTHLLVTFGIIIMSLAIIFSKSRSGVFLLFFSFILFFGLTVIYFKSTPLQNKWIKNFLIVVFLFITFISLYIGIDATLERFALDKLLSEGRPAVWASTVGIVSDFPLFGTGLGTFAYIFPSYEESDAFARYSHAHNDYLEYLSELGILGFVLLFSGILYILINTFLMWRVRRHPGVKGLVLGGIVAVLCMLIHSLSDFNLYIPANMLLFSLVLSLTFVTAFYKRRDAHKH